MKFKNITCLIKVADNQTQTEHFENIIVFNNSKLEIVEKELKICAKDREVVFVASSNVERGVSEGYKRPIINVDVNWVKSFKDIETSFLLPDDVSDILIITNGMYEELMNQGKTDSEVYTLFKKKGLGQMSVDLSIVKDFSALTAQVVD